MMRELTFSKTEADLLDDRRTNRAVIQELLTDIDSLFVLCLVGAELIGSVHIKNTGDEEQIGMLAVSRPRQANACCKQPTSKPCKYGQSNDSLCR